MRNAPKPPDFTLGLGQPTFKLISSYLFSLIILVASARSFGSHPPSWKTTGFSISVFRMYLSIRLFFTRALECTISVNKTACFEANRHKFLKCVSVLPIIGATQKVLSIKSNKKLLLIQQYSKRLYKVVPALPFLNKRDQLEELLMMLAGRERLLVRLE